MMSRKIQIPLLCLALFFMNIHGDEEEIEPPITETIEIVEEAPPDSESNLWPKVVLNMIVKDETAVIQRCLNSAKPLIDYWVIVDTGSSDGTQEMIREHMKDIPGELYERPWVNFAHNRNEALDLAKDKGDYLLLIDADEEFVYGDDFRLPELDKDIYYIETSLGGTKYGRTQLVKNDLNWRWKGVIHEALYSNKAHTSETLQGITNVARPEGNRSKDPLKYVKDAQVIEKALLEDPTNTRYVFYLAQSYRDAGDQENALKNYEKRINMKGWDQEVFFSLLQVGMLKESLGRGYQEVVNSYRQAYAYRPTRAEPLYYLASYQRRNDRYHDALKVARYGLSLKESDDVLFVMKWVHDYGLLLEYSISAYWTGNYIEALLTSNLLLANSSLPSNIRECVEKNLVFTNEKLASQKGKAAIALLSDEEEPSTPSSMEKEVAIQEEISLTLEPEEKSPLPVEEKELPPPPSNEKEVLLEETTPPTEVKEAPLDNKHEKRQWIISVEELMKENPKRVLPPSLEEESPHDVSKETPPLPLIAEEEKLESIPISIAAVPPSSFAKEEPYQAPYHWAPPMLPPPDYEPSPIAPLSADYLPEVPTYFFTTDLYAITHVGRSLGNVGSYQTLGAYFDGAIASFNPFIDCRLHDFGGDRFGANVGLGVRYFDPCRENIYGVNFFYDYRDASARCDLNQVGVGFELLGRRFDFFLNGYLPVARRVDYRDRGRFNYPGGYFISFKRQMEALKGVDFEIGTNRNRWFSYSEIDVYGGLGGYFYNGAHSNEYGLAGVRYRAGIDYRDQLFFGFEGTYDPVFKNNVQFLIGINFSLNSCGISLGNPSGESCFCNRFVSYPVRRNSIILQKKGPCCWDANF